MTFLRQIGRFFLALVAAGAVAASPAAAAGIVTYSWTTTSQGFGLNLGQPTTATFDVALSAVQSGTIGYNDITNIQLAYPGLTFDAFTQSSGGLDAAAYVNPLTGAFIYSSVNQGLSVSGYQGGLFSDSFLTITIGNPNASFNGVADQFNALKNGGAFAGFPTAGFWTAKFPVIVPPPPAVPEPAAWAMMIVGFGAVGGVMRRRRSLTASFA